MAGEDGGRGEVFEPEEVAGGDERRVEYCGSHEDEASGYERGNTSAPKLKAARQPQ